MWFKLFCTLSAQLVTMIQGSPHDLHRTVVQNVSKTLNKNNCWICTQLPPLDGDSHCPLIGILKEEKCIKRWEPMNSALLSPIALTEHGNCTVPCVAVNATGQPTLPSYCHKTNFREIISPKFAAKMKMRGWRLALPFDTGWYWICDQGLESPACE